MIAAVVVMTCGATLAAGEGRAAVAMAAEYDTNARRIAVPVDDTPPPADGLLRTELTGTWTGGLGGARLDVDGALGSKLFFTEGDERMLVAQGRAAVEQGLPAGFVLRVSSFTKGRAQASGARTWAVERGDVSVERRVWGPLVARAGFGGDAFVSLDAPLFSSSTGGASAGLSFVPTGQERVEALVDLGVRAFPLLAAGPSDLVARTDTPTRAHLVATSARAVFVQAAYVFLRNFSNARGESFTRHRLSALVGFRLPLAFLVVAQGALQLTQYDDGISLGQQLFLADDDESQNMVEVALARPWRFGVTFEGRVAWYGNELAKERIGFSRTTASLGVRVAL